MSNFWIIGYGATYIDAQYDGLQYPANQYDYFETDIWKNGSYQTSVDNTSTSTGTAVAWRYSGMTPSTPYTLKGYASYGGTLYHINDGSCTTTAPTTSPATPWSLSTSATYNGPLSPRIYFSADANTHDVYIYCSWYGTIQLTTNYASGSFQYDLPSVPNYNTQYYWNIYARNPNYSSSTSSNQYFTSGSPPLPSTPSSAPTINSRGEGSLNLSWGSASNATSYSLDYRNYAGAHYTSFSGTSGTISSLEYGVTYYLSVAGVNSAGTGPYTSENQGTTNPKTPSISNPSVTNSTITINCDNGMVGNYDQIEIQRYTSGSSYIDSLFLNKSDYDAGNRTVTWSGLPQGTTYIFKARSSFTINGTMLYSSNWSNNITTSTNARPANWMWSSAQDTSGHKVQGATFSMIASEWNTFTDRINQFRSYKGLSAYSFTTASSGSTFYKYMVQQVLTAINDIGGRTTSLDSTTAPTTATARLFNNMMDSLNSAA